MCCNKTWNNSSNWQGCPQVTPFNNGCITPFNSCEFETFSTMGRSGCRRDNCCGCDNFMSRSACQEIVALELLSASRCGNDGCSRGCSRGGCGCSRNGCDWSRGGCGCSRNGCDWSRGGCGCNRMINPFTGCVINVNAASGFGNCHNCPKC